MAAGPGLGAATDAPPRPCDATDPAIAGHAACADVLPDDAAAASEESAIADERDQGGKRASLTSLQPLPEEAGAAIPLAGHLNCTRRLPKLRTPYRKYSTFMFYT